MKTHAKLQKAKDRILVARLGSFDQSVKPHQWPSYKFEKY